MISHHQMAAADTNAEAHAAIDTSRGALPAELVLSDGQHVVRLTGTKESVLMLVDRINDRVYHWRNP